jgi:hypothetical protein
MTYQKFTNNFIQNQISIVYIFFKILPKAPHELARAELKPGSAQLEKNYTSLSLMSRAKKNFGSTCSSRAKPGKI